MSKIFNTNGDCRPELHYMVNIAPKLEEIKIMVDRGDYFTINRARQYGKTTTLKALRNYLQQDYQVLSLDFQKLSYQDFQTEGYFVQALSKEILKKPFIRKEENDWSQKDYAWRKNPCGGGSIRRPYSVGAAHYASFTRHKPIRIYISKPSCARHGTHHRI